MKDNGGWWFQDGRPVQGRWWFHDVGRWTAGSHLTAENFLESVEKIQILLEVK
jgi:hypothetical protein